jgi:hypothetical protein
MALTTGGGLLEAMRTKKRRQELKHALGEEFRYIFQRKKNK